MNVLDTNDFLDEAPELLLEIAGMPKVRVDGLFENLDFDHI